MYTTLQEADSESPIDGFSLTAIGSAALSSPAVALKTTMALPMSPELYQAGTVTSVTVVLCVVLPVMVFTYFWLVEIGLRSIFELEITYHHLRGPSMDGLSFLYNYVTISNTMSEQLPRSIDLGPPQPEEQTGTCAIRVTYNPVSSDFYKVKPLLDELGFPYCRVFDHGPNLTCSSTILEIGGVVYNGASAIEQALHEIKDIGENMDDNDMFSDVEVVTIPTPEERKLSHDAFIWDQRRRMAELMHKHNLAVEVNRGQVEKK